MRAIRLLLLTTLVFVSVSCSKGLPTEDDARQVFENMEQQRLKSGLAELKSFKKVNAKETEYLGTKGYQVEFEAELMFPKGLNPQCISKEGRRANVLQCMMVSPDDAAPVGGKKTIKGKLSFERTEKGWKGDDKKIY